MSRNTLQQQIICDIVKNMRTHPSPDEVYREVNAAHPTISRATVYRVLNKLADKGELLKVNMPNTADRFDFRTDDHIHIYCRTCGKVFDAEIKNSGVVMASFEEKIHESHDPQLEGFEITKVNISLEGICPECKKIKGKS